VNYTKAYIEEKKLLFSGEKSLYSWYRITKNIKTKMLKKLSEGIKNEKRNKTNNK